MNASTLVHRLRAPLAGTVLAVAAFVAPAAGAVEIERVVSPGGIEAWLIEDHKIPVVAMEFAFEGGASLDPEGKEGLANLLSTLLDEGAGPYGSQEFQGRLEDNAIQLSFDAGQDGFYGSLKTLVENQDEAYELTRLALTEPRFEADAIARMKNAVMAGIRQDQSDPNYVAQKAFFEAAFPDHPYGRLLEGTLESVAGIGADDLRRFVAERLAKDRLTIGVTGDITAEELGPVLDRIFGGLPETAAAAEVPDVEPRAAGETIVVPRPTAQSVILVGQEGVKRDDPDWFAASLMNYVLGGGGFSSRLMEEIREKRGLSYGVYSYLVPYDHAALIMGGGSTANRNAAEVIDLIRAEWRRMREEGPTAQELEDAKTYLKGSFPLQFTSTDATARILMQIQRDDLGIDYIDRRAGEIDAVTAEDVRRVARRLLDPEALTAVVVGQPEGIEATRTVDGRPS